MRIGLNLKPYLEPPKKDTAPKIFAAGMPDYPAS
jgi:hypothetical protein